MSSEGTQPPSIAPKKAPAGRPAGEEAPGARTTGTPAAGEAATSTGEKIRRSASAFRSPRAGESGEATATGVAAGASSGTAAAGATAERTSTDRPGPRPAGTVTSSGPRRVRLAVARVDPWSVMKLSFLLSVAVGIMIVVAAAVVWQTLDSLAVFTSVNDTIATITDDPDFFNVLEYAAFPRVISLATMIAVVDVVLLTALSTIGAFLYNIVAALVGGVTVTLTDD